MTRATIGKLPPRFKFILNSYKTTRVSKCPICRRLTHMRKFALLIHIDEWGPLALGKTCRYCSLCELIIAHQDELEDVLVRIFEQHAPEVVGNPYVVLGTLDRKRWKESLGRGGNELTEALKYVADFEQVLALKMEGGWQPMKR